jgi:hypothetical protein
MPSARATLSLVLGVLMIGLGAFVVGRLAYTGGQPLSPSIWLDAAFALFFLVRGAMHLRQARRASREAPPSGG